MSEETAETTAPLTTEPAPAETAEQQPAEIDWKAKAREWEKRAKDNNARIADLEPKAKQYEALEEASKSEAERKDAAAATAQRERDEAKAEASRYKIALRHGIAEDDFDLLGSGTEEQIEARAVKVAAKNEAAKQAALEAAVQPASAPATRPTEQLRPGASPSPDPVQDDSQYPDSWLSPSQRARVEKARGGTPS